MAGKTLYDKLWEMHEVKRRDDGSSLIYIDRHILHEVTSPQAFEAAAPGQSQAVAHRRQHRHPGPQRADHQGRAPGWSGGHADEVSRIQVQTLDENCDDFGILEFKMNDVRQGIVHVIGPEQGATLPGMTVVCGDSHTSTHGAFGALAHGIGTSEVEHVLATQCLVAKKMKNMQVRVEGNCRSASPPDIVLAVIGKIGRRWQWPCTGICRQRDSRPVHGGPHDHLQHGHRGGRPRGHGRRGREDHRTSKGGLTPRRVRIGTRP